MMFNLNLTYVLANQFCINVLVMLGTGMTGSRLLRGFTVIAKIY